MEVDVMPVIQGTSFREVIAECLAAENWPHPRTSDDRAFLPRWAKALDNDIWRPFDSEIARVIVTGAIIAKYNAKEDHELGEDNQVHQAREARKTLLGLAAKATALAEHFEDSANWYKVEQVGLGSIESLSDLHRREAEFLIKRAGQRKSRPTVYVSQKKQGREPRLFIQRLSRHTMTLFCGTACEDIIAEITNLAYPDADITTADVHNARMKLPQLHSEREEGENESEIHFTTK
jgi:hypothetical protein